MYTSISIYFILQQFQFSLIVRRISIPTLSRILRLATQYPSPMILRPFILDVASAAFPPIIVRPTAAMLVIDTSTIAFRYGTNLHPASALVRTQVGGFCGQDWRPLNCFQRVPVGCFWRAVFVRLFALAVWTIFVITAQKQIKLQTKQPRHQMRMMSLVPILLDQRRVFFVGGRIPFWI